MAEVRIEYNDFANAGAYNSIERCILESALKIQAQAKALTPVDLGELRNTIMTKTESKEQGFNDADGEQAPNNQKLSVSPSGLIGYVGTNSDHWYPEFGTRNQAAQPFLRPAVDIVKGATAQEIMKRYGKEEMDRAFQKRKKEVFNA